MLDGYNRSTNIIIQNTTKRKLYTLEFKLTVIGGMKYRKKKKKKDVCEEYKIVLLTSSMFFKDEMQLLCVKELQKFHAKTKR